MVINSEGKGGINVAKELLELELWNRWGWKKVGVGNKLELEKSWSCNCGIAGEFTLKVW